MICLDTNILARYYVDDEQDSEAQKQHSAAKKLIESGQALKVSKTVMLEFEWVLRGYYQFGAGDIASVFRHLLSMDHIVVESRQELERGITGLEQGLDFADALHHAHYQDCDAMASFDDRRFARRVKKLGLTPRIMVLK